MKRSEPQTRPDRSEQREDAATTTVSPPKTRLKISVADKEKLLNWDVGVTPEDRHQSSTATRSPGGVSTCLLACFREKNQTWTDTMNSFHCTFFRPVMCYQVTAETGADQPHTDSGLGQDGESSQSQTSSHSTFQLIASAFRRRFSGTIPSSSSNTAVPHVRVKYFIRLKWLF